jgi:predicted ATP-dependent protease
VYRRVDPDQLGFNTTAELEPQEGIVGQERATRALTFGLHIGEPGFNVYVAGPPGIGKMTAVQSFLRELARDRPVPPDWCYVHNFADPYEPRALRLPPGQAARLARDMRTLVEHLRSELPRTFEGDEYATRRDEIVRAVNAQRNEHFERLGATAAQAGFALEMTSVGLALTPTQNGRRLAEEEFQALPQPVKDEFGRRLDGLQDEIRTMWKQVRDVDRTAYERLRALDQQVAAYVVGGQIDDVLDGYADLPEVLAYLEAARADMLENMDAFKTAGPESPRGGGSPPRSPAAAAPEGDLRAALRKYEVNVLVDNSSLQSAPTLVQLNPSYLNLFGRIEKEPEFGALRTDFTMIRAGALHRANGGYLVLRAEELLRSPFSWDALKRSLEAGHVEIEELGERYGYVAVKTIKPEPIPLDVKVVLVGQPLPYQLLYMMDEEFPELFKVKADFDTHMDFNDENVAGFVRLLCTFCESERKAHINAAGAARLIEHALRLAEDQEKISTHFGALVDIIREARYWATQEGASALGASHVQKAIDERVYRSNLAQVRIQEMVTRGTILIDADGSAVGQVNGLSVATLGDHTFGRPSRITASVGLGRQGVVDIEREVQLGGPIHSKGVLILSGYLALRYSADKPLSLDARLVFEQSYGGIEGDSASSAELYALLSALAGVPILQGIAVTGSVNQSGQVQAIGGVNQKVEGFFDACQAVGLTGRQGVIIPESNARNLMLRRDVVEAIGAGQFHVWAVATIDEGIELLTGTPAGERRADGAFPEGSINRRVDDRLRELAERTKEYRADG